MICVANIALSHNAEERWLWLAHVEHWTGWARLYLASTPCENHTDMVLGITANASLTCGTALCQLGQIPMVGRMSELSQTSERSGTARQQGETIDDARIQA